MQQYLYKFLVLYRKLCIPGLGCFSIINDSSLIDETNGLIFPPKPMIHFNLNESAEMDSQLPQFLTEEMNIDEELAIKEFQDFSSLFSRNLQDQNIAILSGVGRLNKGSNGIIRFTAETNLLEFLPPIDIERNIKVLTKKITKAKIIEDPEVNELLNTEEFNPKAKDYWWIYALGLTLIGLVALLMYS